MINDINTSVYGCFRYYIFITCVFLSGCASPSVSFWVISLPYVDGGGGLGAQKSQGWPLINGPRPAFYFGNSRWYIDVPTELFVADKSSDREENEIIRDIVNMRPSLIDFNVPANKPSDLRVEMYARNEVACAMLSLVSGRLEYKGKEFAPESIEVIRRAGRDGKGSDNPIVFSGDDPLVSRNVSFGLCESEAGTDSRSSLTIRFKYAVKADPYEIYTLHVGRVRESNDTVARDVVFGFSPAIARLESWH
jgi:hypothetical protein